MTSRYNEVRLDKVRTLISRVRAVDAVAKRSIPVHGPTPIRPGMVPSSISTSFISKLRFLRIDKYKGNPYLTAKSIFHKGGERLE
jgi:hypothetical protein